MTTPVLLGFGGASFLLAVGITLWWQAGPAIFAAMTEFGQIICG
ncbi:MAG: hypothetical protein AAF615_00720 [Pseudomonadota bacterium]